MADILDATPLPALGIVKIVVDLGLTWTPLNANPYFESGISSWTAVGTATSSSVKAHEGTKSLLLTPTGALASASVRTEKVAVTAGKNYRTSAWVNCAVTRGIRIEAHWYDASDVEILPGMNTSVPVTANTWTKLDATYTAPDGAVTGEMWVLMSSTPPTSNLLHIDEAEFSGADASDSLPVQYSNTLHLYRVTPDGTEHEIIGSPVLLSDGQAVLYDTTAPFDVDVYYRAQIDNPSILRDNFNRTISSGWGTADSGTTWTAELGTASAHLTNGNQAVHRVAAVNTLYLDRSNTPAMADVDVRVNITLPTTPTGSYIRSNLHFRYNSTINSYFAQIRVFNGGAVQLYLTRQVGGIETHLASTTLPSAFTPGLGMWLEARAIGTTLQARLWPGGTAVPDWQIAASDSTFTSGDVAVSTFFPTGNTSLLPYDVKYEAMLAYSPTPVSLTSDTIQLEAGRDGWVRDPQDPAKSVRLDNCTTHTFECLNADRFVFFQGLEEEQYDSATGVFEVINSEFPLTVAQTRKSATTVLRMVSTTLADIPSLKRLFSPGRDLSLSLPADYGWAVEAYGTAPFAAGDVTVARLNQRDMRKPQRRWSVPLRVTSTTETYPTGATGTNDIPVPGATYQDLTDTGLTYGQLTELGATYQDWSQGVTS